MIQNNRAGTLAICSAMLLAACADDAEKDAGSKDESAAAVPVETARPTRDDIAATYTGTAPIEAFAEAVVIAKVGGEIVEILAEEGDHVSRGTVLARLDGDRLRLEMDQAEANLRKLQRDFQRNIELRDKGLISDGDFEKIQFDMDALQARFDRARLEFEYTQIAAPIDGVISRRFVKNGNTIDVNAETFRVTSLEPLIAGLHVPEREYRRIQIGQPASIEVDALPGQRFAASVARISPVVDPDTGTFKITIEVFDETRRLKPGMLGRIGVVHETHPDALQIPRVAVIEETGQSSVFVVSNGTVARRVIRTGFEQEGRIEVLEGLTDADEIVVVGHTNLKDGSQITVINDGGAGRMPAEAAPDQGEET